MAVKEVIEIEAKTDKAIKEIEGLREQVEELSKAQKEGNKVAEESSKGIGKIASSMGTLVKGAGIGIAIKLFESFTEILQNNQRVADFFSTALEAVSIAFNDLINFLLDNTGPVIDTFKAIFENPVESIKSLGEAIKNNIIERFQSMLDTVGFAGEAIKKFITGDFEGAKEAAKNAGKELVDVYTGVDGTVDKIGETASKVAKSVKEYATETYQAAQNNVELAKAAELAAITNQGLIEKYDRQAEQLRQIRDDERLSLKERREANDELATVLEKQAQEMLKNAQIAVDAAEAELSKNRDNVEAIKAKMEAENELAAIKAQIKGFESEQQSNDLALDREEIEMTRSKAEAEIEAYEATENARIESIDNEREKLLEQDKLEDELFEKRKKLIEDQIANQKEGSTARAELENELTVLKANAAAEDKTRAKELTDFIKKQEEERTAKAKQEADKQKAIEEAKEQAKLDITANALGAAQALAEEGSDTYKALAVAQVLLDTFRGVQAAFASNAANVGATTTTGGAWPFIQAAAAASFGAANIAGILAVDPKKGSSTSPSISRSQGSTVATNTSAPQFNIVQAQQQTRLLSDISGAVGQPARAYVVSSDVSTAQALERKRIKNASF